jgi:hypothetical protein
MKQPREISSGTKETFEVFDNSEMPKMIDTVQRAVDHFIQEKNVLPVADGDPSLKISYFLIKEYLYEQPDTPLYINPKDKMVTHRRPER